MRRAKLPPIDGYKRQFPGSARLFELADSVTELKTVCTCGGKAMVNARIDAEGRVVTEGEQFLLGGNESYRPMLSLIHI